MIGKIEKQINELLGEKGALLFTLIDPDDYKTEDDAVSIAKECAEGGSDAILIGGSISVQGEALDNVAKRIKDEINLPIILFPGNVATLTRFADAVYFMSLLNARNPYWITQAQMLSAPVIKRLGIEPLPVGYIIVQPGGTVGWVGDANMVPREKPKIAAALAIAGEFLGNRFILTDAGSNPQLQHFGPIPNDTIKMVKQSISIPYIAAGGIASEDDARNVFRSGADIIQVGTALESGAFKKTQALARVAKEEGMKKLRGR